MLLALKKLVLPLVNSCSLFMLSEVSMVYFFQKSARKFEHARTCLISSVIMAWRGHWHKDRCGQLVIGIESGQFCRHQRLTRMVLMRVQEAHISPRVRGRCGQCSLFGGPLSWAQVIGQYTKSSFPQQKSQEDANTNAQNGHAESEAGH